MQHRRSPRVTWGEAERAAGEWMTREEVRVDFNCLKGCHVQEAVELGIESDSFKRVD